MANKKKQRIARKKADQTGLFKVSEKGKDLPTILKEMEERTKGSVSRLGGVGWKT